MKIPIIYRTVEQNKATESIRSIHSVPYKWKFEPQYFKFVIYDMRELYWCNSKQVWHEDLTCDLFYNVKRDDLSRVDFQENWLDHWGFELCDGGVQSAKGICIVEVTSTTDNKYVLDFINRIPL